MILQIKWIITSFDYFVIHFKGTSSYIYLYYKSKRCFSICLSVCWLRLRKSIAHRVMEICFCIARQVSIQLRFRFWSFIYFFYIKGETLFIFIVHLWFWVGHIIVPIQLFGLIFFLVNNVGKINILFIIVNNS